MSPPDPSGFVEIAHRVVWCTLSTVDRHGRPRSRLVHPVWTVEGGVEGGALVGRVASRRSSPKSAHLATTPYASCSYWDPAHDVAVAECHAAWDPDPARSWPVFAALPPPVGFDPATVFGGGTDSPDAGVLLLRPWRLRWARATDLAAGRPATVWTAPGVAAA
jgi:hypothetical protein